MWKPLYIRTVPKRNLYSDVKAKLLTGEFCKTCLRPHAKQLKTKQNNVYITVRWNLEFTRHCTALRTCFSSLIVSNTYVNDFDDVFQA